MRGRAGGSRSRRALLGAAAAGLLAAAGPATSLGSKSSTHAASSASAPNGGTEPTYSVLPYGSTVTPAKVAAAVAVIEQRLRAGGVGGSVSAQGDEIVILTDGSAGSAPALASSPQLYFYDWEANLIGPGRSSSARREAGSPRFGLPEYRAVLRAASRRPELRVNDTTWEQGCTSRQTAGCLFGGWYMLDTRHEKMVCPDGASRCAAAATRAALLATTKPLRAARVRVVRVEPGTVLVQARPREAANGRVINSSPDSFYVLKDDPALSGAEVTDPQQGFREAPGSQETPDVTFSFTAQGRHAFEALTKAVAHRGQEAQLPGDTKEAAEQHFAVTLDGQLITDAAIDFTRFPEGIEASHGSEVSGGLTVRSAQELAEAIQEASLPVRIVLRRDSVG